MTPDAALPRAERRDERAARRRLYKLHIKGLDELCCTHDNVMLEACNTSFQVHFQVGPDEFAQPLQHRAGGHRAGAGGRGRTRRCCSARQLWHETRIALFQQSVDTRSSDDPPARAAVRRASASATTGSATPCSRSSRRTSRASARCSPTGCSTRTRSPLSSAARSRALKALRLHNGTVYRWNRACYGVTDGKPHLRIENRVLPGGPDGARRGGQRRLLVRPDERPAAADRGRDPRHALRRREENFVAAARQGLGANLVWPGLGRLPAPELILNELLPIARSGLESVNVDSADIDRYLGVITERVSTQKTGSQWLIDSLDAMRPSHRRAQSFAALVAATAHRQQEGKPVHTWELAGIEEAGQSRKHYDRVEQLMSTDLFTVNEEEVVDVVAAVMKWRHVRRIPVEDNRGRLVGLVSYRTLLKVLSRAGESSSGGFIAVRDIMKKELVTATPNMKTLDAALLMREHHIGSLPIVDSGQRLVGILTEHDLIELAWPLLEAHLGKQ